MRRGEAIDAPHEQEWLREQAGVESIKAVVGLGSGEHRSEFPAIGDGVSVGGRPQTDIADVAKQIRRGIGPHQHEWLVDGDPRAGGGRQQGEQFPSSQCGGVDPRPGRRHLNTRFSRHRHGMTPRTGAPWNHHSRASLPALTFRKPSGAGARGEGRPSRSRGTPR